MIRYRRAVQFLKKIAPVLLDLAAFVVIVIGSIRLFGDPAWLVAGALLITAALRASD